MVAEIMSSPSRSQKLQKWQNRGRKWQNLGQIVAETSVRRGCRSHSCRNGRIVVEAWQNRGRSVAESPNDQPHRQRQSSARNVAESWQKRGRTRLRTPLRPHKRRRRDRHTDRAPTRYGRAHAASLPAPGPRSRANALRGVHCVLLTGAGSLFPEHTSATPTILRGSSREAAPWTTCGASTSSSLASTTGRCTLLSRQGAVATPVVGSLTVAGLRTGEAPTLALQLHACLDGGASFASQPSRSANALRSSPVRRCRASWLFRPGFIQRHGGR